MRARGPRPIWCEPMLWLVTGLPLLVLAAAAVTLALALRAPADASATQVRRIAQVQLEDLGPDREAARRGLRARLEVQPALGRIEVTLAAESDEASSDAEAPLELQLLHPVSASQDRVVALQREGTRWRARLSPWAPQAWEVRLVSAQGAWRLVGRLPRDKRIVALAPAVVR